MKEKKSKKNIIFEMKKNGFVCISYFEAYHGLLSLFASSQI